MSMIRVFGLMLVVGILGLVGCAASGSNAKEEPEVNTELTWQEAKATTQALELEIAELIPKDVIVDVAQADTGMMLSCSNGGDRWFGGMTVTVTDGTDIEAIVRDIETHYAKTKYLTSNRLDIKGSYEVAVKDPKTTTRILIGEGLEPTHIDFLGSSECFVLPEGVYRGGDF